MDVGTKTAAIGEFGFPEVRTRTNTRETARFPAAERTLWISYQTGRGVCVDCATKDRHWSGFAFITVNDRAGAEIARAEWTGSGALNSRQLARRFAADVARLCRSDRSI